MKTGQRVLCTKTKKSKKVQAEVTFMPPERMDPVPVLGGGYVRRGSWEVAGPVGFVGAAEEDWTG